MLLCLHLVAACTSSASYNEATLRPQSTFAAWMLMCHTSFQHSAILPAWLHNSWSCGTAYDCCCDGCTGIRVCPDVSSTCCRLRAGVALSVMDAATAVAQKWCASCISLFRLMSWHVDTPIFAVFVCRCWAVRIIASWCLMLQTAMCRYSCCHTT